MTKCVYFLNPGRFGNNLFQYIASEIIKYIYNFDTVQLVSHIPNNCEIIDDVKFREIKNRYLNNNNNNDVFTCDKDICMNGYFQQSDILTKFKSYVLSLFDISNQNQINNQYRVCDLVNYICKHSNVNDDDLVLHLRLDDYKHNNNPPHIFDKEALGNIIDKIPHKTLYIVCDKLNYDWEKRYVDYFINKYNVKIISGSLLDDFKFIMNSKNIVNSPSTFCWIATYLGRSDQNVYIPYSNFYGEHQILKEHSDNCVVYYNIPFSKNL